MMMTVNTLSVTRLRHWFKLVVGVLFPFLIGRAFCFN